MRLSDRLECIIEMVPKNLVCADIGCDHGFTSIELISRGISPRVIGSDLREGPLAKAGENIRNAGLDGVIELRLSDGFEKYEPGETQTAVIAGMGGTLITQILEKGFENVKVMEGLIVQPQSNIPEFRRFLRNKGFEITENRVVLDAGKYYFPMKIRYTGVCDESREITPEDRYGADLIREDRGLSDYLEFEYASLQAIHEKLISEKGMHDDRRDEIVSLSELNREILSRIKKD